MKNITPFKNILFNSMALALSVVFFASCSSSQQAYNEGDGIYGSSGTNKEVVMVRDTRSDYYQNYFAGEKENSEEIFTNIDAYEGDYENDTVYVENQYTENAPWGATSSGVSINVNVGFGGYYGWGYPYRGYGWGYPYYGYGWGWGYPYYGYGWGYYPPYYGGYYPPYYGGYYPPYHYPGYGYYGRSTYGKRYAYNTARMSTGRINRADSFNSSYRRSNSRNVASHYSGNRSSRSASARGNRSYSNRSSYSNTKSRSSYSNRSRSNQSYNKSSSSARSSSPSYRSSSSGMRSGSSGMRSGSSGMRSGSSGMRSGSSGMRSSSGRRQMSYNNIDRKIDKTNQYFIKRTQLDNKRNSQRVSYANAKSNGSLHRYQKYAPSSTEHSGYRYSATTKRNNNSGRSGFSQVKSSSKSSSSSRSRSGAVRSTSSSARSTAPSFARGSGNQGASTGTTRKR